jgi:hypothetical protein
LAQSPELVSAVIEHFPADVSGSEQQRRSFFFHLQLLQLVEEVFVDLDLARAEKWDHPASRGWRDLITYWARQPRMREVWESQKESYGQPFRDHFDDLVYQRQGVPIDQQQ